MPSDALDRKTTDFREGSRALSCAGCSVYSPTQAMSITPRFRIVLLQIKDWTVGIQLPQRLVIRCLATRSVRQARASTASKDTGPVASIRLHATAESRRPVLFSL